MAWIAVDRALASADNLTTAYIGVLETQRLRSWLASAFPDRFAAHAHTPPAVLLRSIEPATVADRPHGPGRIDTITDVVRTLADISTAIKRDPRRVTAGLLNAVARIGFGAEVLIGRYAGEARPSALTVMRARLWRNVANALTQVRDLRDADTTGLAQEADRAADWLRDQARQAARNPSLAPPDARILRRHLATIAAQSIEPWRHALRAGTYLLTATTDTLADQPHHGIRLPQARWTLADQREQSAREVMHRLADASASAHPTWAAAARHASQRLRHDETAARRHLDPTQPDGSAPQQHASVNPADERDREPAPANADHLPGPRADPAYATITAADAADEIHHRATTAALAAHRQPDREGMPAPAARDTDTDTSAAAAYGEPTSTSANLERDLGSSHDVDRERRNGAPEAETSNAAVDRLPQCGDDAHTPLAANHAQRASTPTCRRTLEDAIDMGL
jgi:hypothetical protein